MAIAIALPGFNDLGRSVTLTFLSRSRFYLQLSPHCPKMTKNSMWEVKKNSRFLSTGHRIFGLTDTVALFANEARFFSDLGCSSGHVLSKMKAVTPHFVCKVVNKE